MQYLKNWRIINIVNYMKIYSLTTILLIQFIFGIKIEKGNQLLKNEPKQPKHTPISNTLSSKRRNMTNSNELLHDVNNEIRENTNMSLIQTNIKIQIKNKENWFRPKLTDNQNEKQILISNIYKTKVDWKNFIYSIRERTITNSFVGYSKLIYIKCKNCAQEFEELSKNYYAAFNQKNKEETDFRMIGLTMFCFDQNKQGFSSCLFSEIAKRPGMRIDTEQSALFIFEIITNEELKEGYIYTPQ